MEGKYSDSNGCNKLYANNQIMQHYLTDENKSRFDKMVIYGCD